MKQVECGFERIRPIYFINLIDNEWKIIGRPPSPPPFLKHI
jgi:hypothetical protein